MTDRKTRLDTLAVVCLVGCSALWGLNQTVSKITLADIPPLLQAGARSLGAALLLALWSRWRGIALWPPAGQEGRRPLLGAGLLAGLLFALEFGCIFIGLQHTHASRMAVFIYLAPFVVALGMPLVARTERPSLLQLLGLLLAFGGVAWALGEGFMADRAAPRQWLGDLLGVAAAVLWGATTLTIRATRLSTAPAEQTLCFQLVVSGVALTAASLLAGEAWPAWSSLGPRPWALMGFQTVVVTFASYLLWFWLVRHYPATQVSAFTLLTPLFGLAAGVALLGEPLTPRLLAAGAAVALGIGLVNRPAR